MSFKSEQSYRDLLSEVVTWGHTTFPNATPVTVLTHLLRECKEWADDPNDPEEMADVIILIAHLRSHLDRLEKQVYERACIAGFDLAKETRKKLEINQQRVWGEPDAQGIIEHVRTEEEKGNG